MAEHHSSRGGLTPETPPPLAYAYVFGYRKTSSFTNSDFFKILFWEMSDT